MHENPQSDNPSVTCIQDTEKEKRRQYSFHKSTIYYQSFGILAQKIVKFNRESFFSERTKRRTLFLRKQGLHFQM